MNVESKEDLYNWLQSRMRDILNSYVLIDEVFGEDILDSENIIILDSSNNN